MCSAYSAVSSITAHPAPDLHSSLVAALSLPPSVAHPIHDQGMDARHQAAHDFLVALGPDVAAAVPVLEAGEDGFLLLRNCICVTGRRPARENAPCRAKKIRLRQPLTVLNNSTWH